MLKHTLTRCSLIAVFLVGCASTAVPAPKFGSQGLLTDADGMTLYTFKKDAPNESRCEDGCAKAWPPYVAKQGDTPNGDFSLVTRRDGSKQWAYKSMPLYRYAADTAVGQAGGDGSGNNWFVVRGAAAAPAAPARSGGGYSY